MAFKTDKQRKAFFASMGNNDPAMQKSYRQADPQQIPETAQPEQKKPGFFAKLRKLHAENEEKKLTALREKQKKEQEELDRLHERVKAERTSEELRLEKKKTLLAEKDKLARIQEEERRTQEELGKYTLRGKLKAFAKKEFTQLQGYASRLEKSQRKSKGSSRHKRPKTYIIYIKGKPKRFRYGADEKKAFPRNRISGSLSQKKPHRRPGRSREFF